MTNAELPAAIAAYFTAELGGDADALARCFTAGATLRDEGRHFEGPMAILGALAAARATYQHRAEPRECVTQGGRILVTAWVSGQFPGSPAMIPHRFTLEGERIAALEIG